MGLTPPLFCIKVRVRDTKEPQRKGENKQGTPRNFRTGYLSELSGGLPPCDGLLFSLSVLSSSSYGCLANNQAKMRQRIFSRSSGSTLRVYIKPPVTAAAIAHWTKRTPKAMLGAVNINSYSTAQRSPRKYCASGGKKPISTNRTIPIHKTLSCFLLMAPALD